MIKLLIVMGLLAIPLLAKDHFRVCVESESGLGCSKEHFNKKMALKIRDMFLSAPIPADYKVWVEDTSKPVILEPQTPSKEPQAIGNSL